MPGSDREKYNLLQTRQEAEWENKCRSCGACCGAAENDPCEHLFKAERGGYSCDIYETRFGMRKTKGGKPFKCVPIRDILHLSWAGDRNCGYKEKSFDV